MKKLIVLAPLLLLGGCGLKMVNKEQALGLIGKAQTEVLKARADGCSEEYVDKIDSAATYLRALVNLFE